LLKGWCDDRYGRHGAVRRAALEVGRGQCYRLRRIVAKQADPRAEPTNGRHFRSTKGVKPVETGSLAMSLPKRFLYRSKAPRRGVENDLGLEGTERLTTLDQVVQHVFERLEVIVDKTGKLRLLSGVHSDTVERKNPR
jgi:hypothetical protein